MNAQKIYVVLVTQSPMDYEFYKEMFSQIQNTSYSLKWIKSYQDALMFIKDNRFDVCLVDYNLGAENGLDFIIAATQLSPFKPYIMLTQSHDSVVDLLAMEAGASDFLITNECDKKLLERSIRYSIQRKKSEKEREDLLSANIEKHLMKKSEEKISNILDSIVNPFLAFDKDWCFTYANKKCCELLGKKREEIIGKNVWRLFPEARDTKFYQMYHKAVETQEMVEFEELSPRMKRWFLVQAYPTRDGLSAYYTDISERREIEKRKDEFIGLASHELKTPVTTIKAYTQLLERALTQNLDAPVMEYLEKMDEYIDKLSGLISNLLDISKIESGNITFTKNAFDIDQLLKEIVFDMQHTTKKHELISECCSEATVVGDRDRLAQAITNLISNAIKYSPHSDKIIITCLRIENNAVVTVKDFGIGIPRDKQDKIFQRFYRVTEQDSQPFPGLGLGLYICREIVKLHRGNIWLDSVPGKGTAFHVAIPSKMHQTAVKN